MQETAREVIPEESGTPLFLLCTLLAENNQEVTLAFDTCASYSLLEHSIPGRKLAACKLNIPTRAGVRGVGGAIKRTRNWATLLPLYNKKYQLVTCQSVEIIISISKRNVSAGIAYIEAEATQLGIPGISELVLEEMVGGRIQGPIGIANSWLMPNLVFMSSLGVGIFKTPLRGKNRGPGFLIGGSYPTMNAIKAKLSPGFATHIHNNAHLYADGGRERISDNLFTARMRSTPGSFDFEEII